MKGLECWGSVVVALACLVWAGATGPAAGLVNAGRSTPNVMHVSLIFARWRENREVEGDRNRAAEFEGYDVLLVSMDRWETHFFF